MDAERELFEQVRTTGQRIRVCRFRMEVPQQNVFARSHGLQPSVLSMVERGKRTPSAEMIRVLSKAFDVAPRFLLEGDHQPPWWNPEDLEDVLYTIRSIDRRNTRPSMSRPSEFLRDTVRTSNTTSVLERIALHEFESLTPYYMESPSQVRDLVRYLLMSDTHNLTPEELDQVLICISRILK